MKRLRPRSISRRLAASITAAAVVVSGATILVMYLEAARELDAGLSRKADDAREYLVGALELPLWSLDRGATVATCRAFAQNDLVVRLVVRDDSGDSVCDIDNGPDLRPLRRTAALTHRGVAVGELELLLTRRHAFEEGRRLLYAYGATMLVVSIALALLTTVLVRVFLKKPVDALVAMVRPFAAGDYAAPPDELPYLEFQGFARTLAGMGETIRRQFQALRDAEEKYRSIFENAREGLFQTSTDGRYLSANPALARIHGYGSPEELMASVTDLRHQHYVDPADRERFRELIEEHGYVERFEVEQFRGDGSRIWVSINARAVRSPGGEVLFYEGSVEDVSERRRAEREVRRLNQELERRVLERTAQLEAATREMEGFVYSISHDLRAPLRHVDGYVELLRRRLAASGDEEVRRHMDLIGRSARRMGDLMDALLSFARMGRQDLARQAIDLDGLAREVMAELVQDASLVQWEVGALPVVVGDRAMLRIVLVNLLSNAVKFTRPCRQPRIEIGAHAPADGEVEVFVRDNGVGFDPAYAAKLFGVFQRLHRAEEFEGTGIGLATVRRIVARFGGRTWAEGTVGGGATFSFTLPCPDRAGAKDRLAGPAPAGERVTPVGGPDSVAPTQAQR